MAEVHHDETPGSTLTVLERAGHYPVLEAPTCWVAALLEVLLEQVPSARGVPSGHD